jgi:CelD/BcsL family acetyltransferase involved in cellulose biosynthesis
MDLYRQWFPKLLAQGQLVASELKLSGKTANLQFGVQIDGRIHSIFTINTGVHLDLYPNIVGMYLRIKDACNKGVQCIDLDYGAFPHKLQAETHQEEYCRVLFANPKSLLGLFYVSYQMVKNRNKVRFHL